MACLLTADDVNLIEVIILLDVANFQRNQLLPPRRHCQPDYYNSFSDQPVTIVTGCLQKVFYLLLGKHT